MVKTKISPYTKKKFTLYKKTKDGEREVKSSWLMVSSPLKGPPTFLLLLESACPLRVHQGARGHPLDPGLHSLRWLFRSSGEASPLHSTPLSERVCLWHRSGTLAISLKENKGPNPPNPLPATEYWWVNCA